MTRVLDALAVTRGLPLVLRTDNGAEFRTEAVETWQGCIVSATPTKVRVKRAE